MAAATGAIEKRKAFLPPERLEMRQATTLAIRRQRGTEITPVPVEGVGCCAWAGILPKRRNILTTGFIRTEECASSRKKVSS